MVQRSPLAQGQTQAQNHNGGFRQVKSCRLLLSAELHRERMTSPALHAVMV